MPRPQQLDHLVGQFAVVGDGVERLERCSQRLAPGREFRLMLRQMFGATGLREAEPADHQRQPQPKAHQGDENDPERDKQDQIAVGKIFPGGQRVRQRQRRGQRDGAAHAGEGNHERPLPGRRRITFAQPFAQHSRQIGCGIDPGKTRHDDHDGD